jgi:hypothetical protein
VLTAKDGRLCRLLKVRRLQLPIWETTSQPNGVRIKSYRCKGIYLIVYVEKINHG